VPCRECDRLEEVRLPLSVVPDDEVQAGVELAAVRGEVPERLRREGLYRNSWRAARYMRSGITTYR